MFPLQKDVRSRPWIMIIDGILDMSRVLLRGGFLSTIKTQRLIVWTFPIFIYEKILMQ